MKKVDNSANFEDGGIISHRKHYNSFCRDKHEHWLNEQAVYVMIYDVMSHVMLPHTRKLSPAPTSVA
jgi:hypothetical protein